MDTTVLVAIVSASSVLLGAAISQGSAMIQSRLDRKHKREILLRTKYEELGFHFLASTEMPGQLMKCTSHEEIQGALHQTEANQAQLLALIYFPPLREPIQRYVASYQHLCFAVAEIYYKAEGGSVGGKVGNHPDYRAVSSAHIAERENVATEIENHAPRYTKS